MGWNRTRAGLLPEEVRDLAKRLDEERQQVLAERKSSRREARARQKREAHEALLRHKQQLRLERQGAGGAVPGGANKENALTALEEKVFDRDGRAKFLAKVMAQSYEDGSGVVDHFLEQDEVSPLMQEILQPKWEAMGREEQDLTRARRAKQGYKCDKCGARGYFRRNCRTCPPCEYSKGKLVAVSQPDSDQEPRRADEGDSVVQLSSTEGGGTEALSFQGQSGSKGLLWGAKALLTGSGSIDTSAIRELKRTILENESIGSVELSGSSLDPTWFAQTATSKSIGHGPPARGTIDATSTISLVTEAPAAGQGTEHHVGEEAHSGEASLPANQHQRSSLTWKWPAYRRARRTESAATAETPGGEGLDSAAMPLPATRITGFTLAKGGIRTMGGDHSSRSYLHLRNHKTLAVEQNFFLVLERLCDAARQQVEKVSAESFPATILRGPKGHHAARTDGGEYYPPSMYQDYRDFFTEELAQRSKREILRSHNYQGHLKRPDKLNFPFDRTSHCNGQALGEHFRKDYTRHKKGYRGTNVHHAGAWRDITTSQDKYASSGRAAAQAEEDIEASTKEQSAWVQQQQVGLQHERERANHLLAILQEEVAKEHAREGQMLPMRKKEQRVFVGKSMQARAEAADRIMKTLHAYHLTDNLENAEYILYCLDSIRRGGFTQQQQRHHHQHHTKSSHSESSTPPATATLPPRQQQQQQQQQQDVASHRSGKRSSKAGKRASGAGQAQQLLPQEATMSNKSVQRRDVHRKRMLLKSFENAGLQDLIRRGQHDDSISTPAVIPIPGGIASGAVDDGAEKSVAAARILNKVKEDISAKCARPTMLPLWTRAASNKRQGQVDASSSYSVLLNQSFSKLR